jgi:hypothetical protein
LGRWEKAFSGGLENKSCNICLVKYKQTIMESKEGVSIAEEDVSIVEEDSIRLTVQFSRSLLGKIDELRRFWGFRSRGATIQRILMELFEELPSQVSEDGETNQIDESQDEEEKASPELGSTSDLVTDHERPA